mmetsp:Transcript_13022/g.22375  ORF Transcript_13022/g.22375 Transcript_13022/m.22375 type:complete len:456 (+) Transcript_13022:182-1549(+)
MEDDAVRPQPAPSPLPNLEGWFDRQPTINNNIDSLPSTPGLETPLTPNLPGSASVFQPISLTIPHSRSKRQARNLKLDGCILRNYVPNSSVPLWEVNLRINPMERVSSDSLEFVVHLPRGDTSFWARTEEEANVWEEAASKINSRDVSYYYELIKVIGEGAFAEVYLAKSKSSGGMVAVKRVFKQDHDDSEALVREISILKSVKHVNIISTFDVFDSPSYVHIVLEYIQGGELFDLIASAGKFSEKNASQIMKQMFEGLRYLHTHRIVHRDIKPENVLCTNREWPVHVKLCDFGLAEVILEARKDEHDGLVGTPGYVAPEVVRRQKIGPPVDMWSAGVLLFIMLSGKMCFYGRDEIECLRKIARGLYSFPEAEWKHISEHAKSLVRGLLCVDQDKRLSAEAALYHPFITGHDISEKPIENDLSGLSSSRRRLQKAVKAVITVNQMNAFLKEIREC